MKLFTCISVALGLIVIASALKCKKCDFRALSICFTKSGTDECNGNCTQTKVAIGSFNLFNQQNCSMTCEKAENKTDSIFRLQYSTTCCNTDDCNSGNSVKVSVSLGLGIGLLWLLNTM